MADDLHDLFEGPPDSPAESSPSTPPAPPPPSGYAPSMEGLAQEVGQLKQLVQTLLPTLLRSHVDAAAVPAPGRGTTPPNPLDYQDQEYLDETAANALLSSPNVRGELNSMLNRTARQVHTKLATEIARTRTDFEDFRAQNQRAQQQWQAGQQMQSDFSAFYGEHPELEPHAELVMLEAQNMAREYNQNPYAFTGLTRERVMQSLADRTQQRVAAIVAAANGQPGPPPSRLPARRTQVERGSGTRIGAPAVPKNANDKELEEMDRFVRG